MNKERLLRLSHFLRKVRPEDFNLKSEGRGMVVIEISNPARSGTEFVNPNGGFVCDAAIIPHFEDADEARQWLDENEPTLGLHVNDVLSFVHV